MQISPSSVSKFKLVRRPFPGGIVEPVKENPKTTPADEVETLNPASSAEPSPAPVRVAPLTTNWNPATGPSLFIIISIL
jgi:hypothetical protein